MIRFMFLTTSDISPRIPDAPTDVEVEVDAGEQAGQSSPDGLESAVLARVGLAGVGEGVAVVEDDFLVGKIDLVVF